MSAAIAKGTKHIRRPVVGRIAMKHSASAIDGQSDIGMVIYTPASPSLSELAVRLRKRKIKTPPD